MAHLDHLLRSGSISEEEAQKIEKYEELLGEKGFKIKLNEDRKFMIDNLQNKFEHFSVLFENQIRLLIQDEEIKN